ncbi:MAG: lipid A biosynthesis acyltransferase [Caulobacteraceae bacterium]|nr:lipid A biosynthesis acyltransferase [Caulobacteraceae bacterium]
MRALLRALPVDWASAFGGWLLRTLGPLSPNQKVALTNLGFAFPQMSEAERRALLPAIWDNIGRTFAEFVLMDRINPESGRVEIVGAERLAAIKASGKPVIFVSGHFANWEVMMVALFSAGIEAHVAYRPTNNPYVNRRIVEGRARYGITLLSPKGKGGRDLMLSLRRGTSLAILIDQKDSRGVDAPFFGKPAPTMPGAARMALHYGLPVQPLSIERLEGARFRMTVGEPIMLEKTGDTEADIVAGTLRINAFLEDVIRVRPEGWFWVHRRWRREDYPGGDAKRRERLRRRAAGKA